MLDVKFHWKHFRDIFSVIPSENENGQVIKFLLKI